MTGVAVNIKNNNKKGKIFTMTVVCPFCRSAIQHNAENANADIICPSCGKLFMGVFNMCKMANKTILS